MAIDDNTTYGLTGAQVKDLAQRVKDAGEGLTTLSYGSSTWNDFITAYNAGKIVYCRASSNSNPATGSQTRMAFMAYVNNSSTPTEVEFQYVRSVSTKSASNQSDQVFVYKLTSANGGTWTVETRPVMVKISAGTNMTSSYSNNTLTLDCTVQNSSYSTSEADTGTTWIDGSPIYKKTIDTGVLPNNASKTVQHGVGTNLKRAIKIEGYAYSPNLGINMSIPDNEIKVQVAGVDIEIYTSADLSMFTESYVTLYYTKTQ